MKVLFLQTAHPKDDDRIAFHQQVCLEKAGHHCLFSSLNDVVTDIPDVVICDTPRAIHETRKRFGYQAKVIYDITEWYPSKKNLRNVLWPFRPFKFCLLTFANIWAGYKSDAFIFGEYHKAIPFKILFPRKQNLLLSYYPSLQYIHYSSPGCISHEVKLLYAGPQTKEKGYFRVQELARICQTLMPDKHIKLTTINGLTFQDFCSEITHHDIFLDLRDNDVENTRCLPIKLFYYMAAGKAIIYSDLKAIRKGVPEITHDSLVNPYKLDKVALFIQKLVTDSNLYQRLCERNRRLAETKYNWEIQSDAFVRFIE